VANLHGNRCPSWAINLLEGVRKNDEDRWWQPLPLQELKKNLRRIPQSAFMRLFDIF
jgi:hypothetical protein